MIVFSKPFIILASIYSMHTNNNSNNIDAYKFKSVTMKIIISNASPEPIYEQIGQQIKAQIISGDLMEGDPLPSIRNLAKELHISVITTKRTYEELEKEGFIDTVGGKGTFVAIQNKELMREKKMKSIEDRMNEVVLEAQKMEISFEELQEMLAILYNDNTDYNAK